MVMTNQSINRRMTEERYRVHWRARIKSWKAENFLTSWAIISSSTTLLHRVCRTIDSPIVFWR